MRWSLYKRHNLMTVLSWDFISFHQNNSDQVNRSWYHVNCWIRKTQSLILKKKSCYLRWFFSFVTMGGLTLICFFLQSIAKTVCEETIHVGFRGTKFERIALNCVYYHMWTRSPVQVQRMRQGAQGWCTEMTQRDGMGREVGGGFRMGNTCTPVADSCQCMAKPPQYCN